MKFVCRAHSVHKLRLKETSRHRRSQQRAEALFTAQEETNPGQTRSIEHFKVYLQVYLHTYAGAQALVFYQSMSICVGLGRRMSYHSLYMHSRCAVSSHCVQQTWRRGPVAEWLCPVLCAHSSACTRKGRSSHSICSITETIYSAPIAVGVAYIDHILPIQRTIGVATNPGKPGFSMSCCLLLHAHK